MYKRVYRYHHDNFTMWLLLLMLLAVLTQRPTQAMFYLLYSYTIYAMDFIFQQQFYATQIWSAHDFSFVTGRGWISIMGLIFSLMGMCSIVLGVVTERSMVRTSVYFVLDFSTTTVVTLLVYDWFNF